MTGAGRMAEGRQPHIVSVAVKAVLSCGCTVAFDCPQHSGFPALLEAARAVLEAEALIMDTPDGVEVYGQAIDALRAAVAACEGRTE